MNFDDLNCNYQRLDNKEFRVKFKTGDDIFNAANHAIAGEMFVATGDNGALYFATQTSGANHHIYKAGDLPSANKFFGNRYSSSLDGTDQAIKTTYSPTVGSTAFTATMWVKSSNTTTSQGFISNMSASSVHNLALISPDSTNSFFVIINDGSTQSVINGIGGNDSTLDIRDGNWHHLAITVNGTSVKIYKDGGDAAINGSNPTNTQGTPFGTWTSSTSYIGVAQDFWIGTNGALTYSNGNRYYLDGNIDEVAVWESELSGSDISAIYNSGTPSDLSSYSPVGWWRMGDKDGGAGTTITDQGSGGNNATLDNGATFSTDTPLPAANRLFTNQWSALFDGIDDFFTLSSTATLSASTGYTLSAWINSTQQSGQQHILKAGSTDYISILNDEIWINGTSTFKTIPNSTRNADDLQGWHHHVVTYDGSVAKYYLDGVYEGSVSGTIGDIAVATLSVGETYQFHGYMSDVALFDSALTDGGVSVGEAAGGEIASLINNGKPLDISTLGLSLKAWWRFGDDPNDNPSGGTSISSVTDSSGNGYTLSALGNDTPYYHKLPSYNVHQVG